MKKLIALFLSLVFVLALVGCGKAEPSNLRVYSFSGADGQFSVTNGVIVLDDTVRIFNGGNLKVTEGSFSNIASYTATFYIVENDEKKVILSNSATDTTGSSVSFKGNLGQISGEGALIEAMIKDTSDWENNLYLELTTTDKSGTDNVYQLQMSLTEVTDAES